MTRKTKPSSGKNEAEILAKAARARNKGKPEKALKLLLKRLKKHPGSAPVLHQLGFAYADNRQWLQALDAFMTACDLAPENLIYLRRVVDAMLANGRFEEAAILGGQVIAESPEPREADYQRLANAYRYGGQDKRVAETCLKFAQIWKKRQIKPADAPPLIIAALPQSASTSLSHAIATSANRPMVEFMCCQGAGFFGLATPIGRVFKLLGKTGVVNHSHLEPRRRNLEVLANNPAVRVAVHFRDPRESLVSALDMIQRNHSPQFLLKNPDLPDLPLDRQVDWMIANYLPYQVWWIKEWGRLVDERMPQIVVTTTFNQLINEGQDGLAYRVCKSADIPVVNKSGSKPRRYKLKSLGRWQDVFTQRQKAAALELLSQNICKRFQ